MAPRSLCSWSSSRAACAKRSSARFDVWLGGGTVGVVITSVAFGAGHLLQGVDAAIATGTLGAFWGVLYLRRRSAVAPVVSHSGFNVLQILQALAIGH